MSWYKRSSVISVIEGLYSINKQELGRIFSSLWLELVSADIHDNNYTILCRFKSPKLEGNMLMGTLKELERALGRVKGITKVKSKMFDYTVELTYDKEIIG